MQPKTNPGVQKPVSQWWTVGISAVLVTLSVGTAAWLIGRIVHSAKPVTSQFVADNAIIKTGAAYKTVKSKPDGWLKTGQNADIALSAIDFNNAGGPLLFNHQGGIATDGRHLLLADRNNNRVLIWNQLPSDNTKPDLVLGQPNFTANNPGDGLSKMNWPVSVATDGTHVFVADTYNDRILVWNSFPTTSNQPADFALTANRPPSLSDKPRITWPWAVWTNGRKFIVANTGAASVLIWNSIPTQSNQSPDIVLRAGGNFGTPRSIASDGTNLLIGDHNAKPNSNNPGNFFWKTFPTKNDQPYDFFLAGVGGANQRMGEVLWGGVFAPGGKFITIGQSIHVWNKFPVNDNEIPTTIGASGPGQSGYQFDAGDGSGVALAGNRLYVSASNGNRVVVYRNIPASAIAKPDFAIGSSDINTNTLETNFIMSNPVPATDGKSLFVSSDFDNKLYVYKNLPDESNAHPDYIYPYGGWDNALYGNTFAEVNSGAVLIWKTLPTHGQPPDEALFGHIGSIKLQETKGVAIDGKYFYLSDKAANKVYVFEGIPNQNSKPKFTFTVNNGPVRLDSDGKYLLVMTTEDNVNGHARIFRVDQLSNDAKPAWVLVSGDKQVMTNLPQGGALSNGRLFIADTGFNRVLVWSKIEDAIAGAKPDIILGKDNLADTAPRIGQNQTFWPANAAFDGHYLWLGEFKFSERLLRFSVK